MHRSPPGSSVHGISQARILEWVAIPFSRGSSWPEDQTHISCIAGGFFTTEPPGKPCSRQRAYKFIWVDWVLEGGPSKLSTCYSSSHNQKNSSGDVIPKALFLLVVSCMYLAAPLCLTLFDPMDCSLPGSSVHGILQERILEWVAMPSSRGSSQPRDGAQVFLIAGRFFIFWTTREAQLINTMSFSDT